MDTFLDGFESGLTDWYFVIPAAVVLFVYLRLAARQAHAVGKHMGRGPFIAFAVAILIIAVSLESASWWIRVLYLVGFFASAWKFPGFFLVIAGVVGFLVWRGTAHDVSFWGKLGILTIWELILLADFAWIADSLGAETEQAKAPASNEET